MSYLTELLKIIDSRLREIYVFGGLERSLLWSSIYIDRNLIQWEDERSKDCIRLLGTILGTTHSYNRK